ncbi:MAG: PAS domain-containing protein [Bryobacterales bacterium]|nr:PAS domain-containing protein [Bryobacterales bacterium]
MDRILQAPAHTRLAAAALLLALVFLLDNGTPDLALGVVYMLPILLAATALSPGPLIALGVVCGVARTLNIHASSSLDMFLRALFSAVAYVSAGLFVRELMRNRHLSHTYVSALREFESLQRETEEQLRVLAESSPAAIFTLDADTKILSANSATNELLGFDRHASLVGEPVGSYLPVLVDALRLDPQVTNFRTATQCPGRRRDHQPFVAQIWFSTYQCGKGRRLAAIAVDISDEVREREEHNLKQLLDNNRIIAGAVSDELRNICGAAALTYTNLKRVPGLLANNDFRAMGGLILALEWIASMDLKNAPPARCTAGLPELLNQLRIVIDPAWTDIDATLKWNIAPNLPRVEGETTGLLQALLNIAQNCRSALDGLPLRHLEIKAYKRDDWVRIEFLNSSPAVQDPAQIFLPFRTGADTIGLDVYVSRAIMRSYGGDVRYEPYAGFCRFMVELRTASSQDERG